MWNLLCKADKSLEGSRVKNASARVMSTWEGTVLETGFFQRVTLFRGMTDFQDNVHMRWTMKSRCNETFVSAMFGLGVFWCRENNCWWTTLLGIFSFCILLIFNEVVAPSPTPRPPTPSTLLDKKWFPKEPNLFSSKYHGFCWCFLQPIRKKFVPYE